MYTYSTEVELTDRQWLHLEDSFGVGAEVYKVNDRPVVIVVVDGECWAIRVKGEWPGIESGLEPADDPLEPGDQPYTVDFWEWYEGLAEVVA